MTERERGWEDASSRAERLLTRRLQKIEEWLDWLDDVARQYAEIVLSRESETAALAGFDPEPRWVVCRHPVSARMGKLCLLCDNTGLVPKRLARDGDPVDPYSLDTPKSTAGIRTDQSLSGRRARDMERLNAAISALQRDARLRAGAEVRESQSLRLVRLVESTRHDHPTLRRLERALGHLKQKYPRLYQKALAREPQGLAAIEILMPGKMDSVNRAVRYWCFKASKQSTGSDGDGLNHTTGFTRPLPGTGRHGRYLRGS